jgi:DNA-binding CsgD family transcriptional regulator
MPPVRDVALLHGAPAAREEMLHLVASERRRRRSGPDHGGARRVVAVDKPGGPVDRCGAVTPAPSRLQGRRAECWAIDGLLDAARDGQSAALVVHGEPGIGKTALLQHAVDRASGFQVVRAVGAESEMDFDFAALHQVCRPMLDRLEDLPGPQRDALEAAFGVSAGGRPDRFLVGVALLSLLSQAADEQPLLCVVDDAQWLDRSSAQALAFVARRLGADSVAMVFAVREPGEDLAGLSELPVHGLSDRDARVILRSVIRGPLDARVRDRLVAEARGNPLALRELPYGLAPVDLAGGFGLPTDVALAGRVEESFVRRLEGLPAESQRLLLLAAAEPVGEAALLWRAARQLGIDADAAIPAEATGLLQSGGQLKFSHPVARSAAYRAASVGDRRAAHRALAAAMDPDVDPDRRAWHRAEAADRPDGEVAMELERSAERARARGGLAAVAAFLERAAALTPEPALRAERALAAAQAKHEAGAPDAALELLATAETGPLDELDQVRLERLRARVELGFGQDSDAPALLLKAAKRFEPLDAGLARETYLEALEAALFASRPGSRRAALEAAQAARSAPPATGLPTAADLLLDGLATLHGGSEALGVATLKRALAAFRAADLRTEDDIRWLWLACGTAAELWDSETGRVLATRHVELSRETGALARLPHALEHLAALSVLAGDVSAASALIEEADAITAATGAAHASYGSLFPAVRRSPGAQVSALIEAAMRNGAATDEDREMMVTERTLAVLENGRGNYGAALVAARKASEDQFASCLALPELIEAATRSGEPELAATSLDRLSARTQLSGTEWALGVEARSRALVSENEVAEGFYREAIDRLGRTRMRVELARAHLLYGEWLRRERRRLDAREQLRTAHEMFAAMGIEAFAQRARRELRATGETARKRVVATRGQLTAQEAHIARLARDGLSNPEIGARLFISPRTVEYHLRKVFTKLDISSRRDLEPALANDPDVAQAA